MAESKIQINKRKIKNGLRKHKEAQQKKMWQTLASESTPPRPQFPDITMYGGNCNENPIVYHMPVDSEKIRGKNFDSVIIDEIKK